MKMSEKTHHWLAFVLAVMLSLPLFAQNITVTGVVSDATGEPLAGATVLQKGSSNGVATDLDGKFTISVPSKANLVVSFIGCETATIAVDGRTTIDVTLKDNSTVLDEVVAIGYATVKKKDLTGAVSSVSGTELTRVPVGSAAAALQGKAAGVNITTQNSAPGASLNITVRGGTSITQGTAPLYIVDGFEMDNALTNIDINDIETIDILKDASATAIYGARGSNGIIVITTKSAQKGKTKIDYNAFFSWEKLSKKLDLMNNAADYVRYQYELAELQGNTSMWSVGYDGMGVDEPGFYTGVWDRINSNYAGSYAEDWQDLNFGGTAFTQNHNVSIATGSDKTQVLITYNHNGQDGLLANHDYQRNSIRAKINAELWKGVRLDFSAFYFNNITHGGGNYSGMKNVLMQPINGGILFTEDELVNTQTYPTYNGLSSLYDTANPLIANLASVSEKRARRFEVNAGVTIDFLKDFSWRTAGNYVTKWDKSSAFSDERSVSYLVDPINTGMAGSLSSGEGYSWRIVNTLNYHHEFNKVHDLTVMLGQEYSYSESESMSLSLRKFPYPNHGLDDISGAECYEKKTGHSHGNMLSFFGRVSYNYDERYLLTATMRADGSSKFAKGNKWGFFPSASGAWRVSQERFWQESPLINWWNNFKFRIGYGITGNCNIGSNLYTTRVQQTSYPINNNENAPAYVLATTLGNEKLKWETLHATNVGVDLGFFNNRVMLTVDWYNNQISDMLMQCIIPKSTGYSYQYQNVGKMRNRGWEISLNTVNIATRNFQWTSTLNLSFNRSKVISLEGGQDSKQFGVGNNRGGQVTYYATVGQPLGDMYGYKYEGIYTTDDFIDNGDGTFTLKDGVVKPYEGNPMPGDIKFAADNEDGTQFTREKVKIGNGTPDCIGGFNNTFTYRGFDLNVFMKFSIGNDMYNATKHSMIPYAPYQNTLSEFGDNYYRLIDPATGVRATSLARIAELNPDQSGRTWSLNKTNSDYITYPSSYYVEDASYLRLAQITLGYTLPAKLTKKAYISSLRVYFTANNVATITGYSGYNPDASSANDHVICTPGYDSSSYPMSRSYVVGVNLSF